jgi:hypothetical protein
VHRSSVCDVPLLRPFQASAGTIMDKIEELCSIATQYAIRNKVAQLHPAPSSSREESPDVVIQAAEEGGKKRRKQCCQETATTADDKSRQLCRSVHHSCHGQQQALGVATHGPL